MSYYSGNKRRVSPLGSALFHMGILSMVAVEAFAAQGALKGIKPADRESTAHPLARWPEVVMTAASFRVEGRESLLLAQADRTIENDPSGENLPDAEPEAIDLEGSSHDSVSDAVADSDEDGGRENIHRLKGFVQSDNFISISPDQEFSGAFKKNEIRNSLDYRLGTSPLHLQVKSGLSLLAHVFSDEINSRYVYSDRFRVDRNLRITSPSVELNFNELYVNYEIGIVRMRLGNQLYSWGTTDAFNPTAYFNPYDLREFLFKDQDDIRIGVPSVSALITIGECSLELVLVPVHVPMILPEPGNFWGITYREGPFPVTVARPGAMDVGADGIGAGVQLYMNYFRTDMYLTLYRGPDREPVLRPWGTIIAPNALVSLLVVPEYHPFTAMGVAVSRPVDKFIVQAEFSYSPDRTGVVEQPYTKDLTLPFELRRSHYISYSIGCNYLVPLGDLFAWHDGDAVLTVEWMQSRYTDGELMKPLFTDILVAQFRDSFFDSRLKASLTAIIDIADGSYSILPAAEYKFKNGVSLMLSCVFIESREGSILGYYNDNDGVILRVRYEY